MLIINYILEIKYELTTPPSWDIGKTALRVCGIDTIIKSIIIKSMYVPFEK